MKNIFNFKKVIKEESYSGEIEKEILNIPKIVAFSILGLFILITIFLSFTTVKSGEVGLRVRFGKIVDSSISEGFNLKIPYVEQIKKVNIKVQKVELETLLTDKPTVNTMSYEEAMNSIDKGDNND